MRRGNGGIKVISKVSRLMGLPELMLPNGASWGVENIKICHNVANTLLLLWQVKVFACGMWQAVRCFHLIAAKLTFAKMRN